MKELTCAKCGKVSYSLIGKRCRECNRKHMREKKDRRFARKAKRILECFRCGHSWTTKMPGKETPKVCPKCYSAWWDLPRKPDRKITYSRGPDKKLMDSYPTRQQYFREKYG